MRFFFDYTSENSVIFDYSGSEFKSPQSALEFAQETLSLLKNSLTQEWAGWSILVCNPQGAKLCSLPIDAPENLPLKEYDQGSIASAS